LLGHARETDPARTVLIFYPFFYRFWSRTANVGGVLFRVRPIPRTYSRPAERKKR